MPSPGNDDSNAFGIRITFVGMYYLCSIASKEIRLGQIETTR